MLGFNSKKKPKKILLISSSITSPDSDIDTYDYFAGIASELAINLQSRHPEYELVLKVPEGGIKAKDQQVRFISEAITPIENYECIVISPVDRDNLYPMMNKWIKEYGKNRIIFIDQGYTKEDYEYFHTDDISRPPFVQADWKNGGKVAAESMFNVLSKHSVKCPNIALLKGKIGSPERIKGFKEFLSSQENPSNFKVCYTEFDGDYSRKKALEVFEPYLKTCIEQKKPIDGVFAVNDEMALGVREAIYKNKEEFLKHIAPVQNNRLPFVIGFDGIRDATLLIDNKDDLIYDTVDVRLKEQIKKLSSLIEAIIISKTHYKDEDKFVLMPCISYRELKKLN